MFRLASLLPTEEEQGAFIRKNFNETLRQWLKVAFLPEYVFDLPEGAPPYTPSAYLDQESNLYSETRRLYIFMVGSGDHVKQKQKESNFVQLLENLSPDDAVFLLAVKEKSLPFGFDRGFIERQLPNLLPPLLGEEVAEQPAESPQPSVVESGTVPTAPTSEKVSEPAKKRVVSKTIKSDTKIPTAPAKQVRKVVKKP